jgi:hypothetical protein
MSLQGWNDYEYFYKKMRKNVLSVCVILLLIAGICWYLISINKISSITFPATLKENVIDFSPLASKIYINTQIFGYTGSSERINISTSPLNKNKTYGKDSLYVIYSDEIYFKKIGIDTLIVFANASSIIPGSLTLKTPVKIIIKELNSYDEIHDYSLNFKKYGLTKFSVYND